MKFYLKTALLCLICLGFNTSAQAQFLKTLGEKVGETVKEKVSEKTDKKAGETTEDAMDGIFGARKKRKAKKEKEEAELLEAAKKEDGIQSAENSEPPVKEEGVEEVSGLEGILGGLNLGNMQSSTDYSNAAYSFSFTAKIEVETYNKEEKEVHNMVQSYGTGCMHAEMNGTNMLFDYNNQDMITLDNDNKTASVMSMKWLTSMGDGQEEDEDVVFSKTGKTKTINGYLCDEYLIISEDSKIEAWFAPTVPFSYENHMSSFAKVFGKKNTEVMADQGYVMELTAYDKKDVKSSHMIVLEISELEFDVNLSDYTVKSMF